MRCQIHNVSLVCFCPVCRGKAGGAIISEKKTASSRKNGKLGGRPRRKRNYQGVKNAERT